MGTVVVLANMNAEKTQLYRESPPRADTTVGMAALTMVASTAAENMATMRAAVMMIRRDALMAEGWSVVVADIDHLTFRFNPLTLKTRISILVFMRPLRQDALGPALTGARFGRTVPEDFFRR